MKAENLGRNDWWCLGCCLVVGGFAMPVELYSIKSFPFWFFNHLINRYLTISLCLESFPFWKFFEIFFVKSLLFLIIFVTLHRCGKVPNRKQGNAVRTGNSTRCCNSRFYPGIAKPLSVSADGKAFHEGEKSEDLPLQIAFTCLGNKDM